MAWWRGLGGIPFEPEIVAAVNATRRVFESLGCIVEEAEPDFSGVAEAFPVLRYATSYAQNAPLVRQNPEWVKDTIRYEVAQAERLTAADVGRALARQTQMHEQTRAFSGAMRTHPAGHPGRAVRRHGAVSDSHRRHADEQLHRLMRSCWCVTFMGGPAASVPAGFTASDFRLACRLWDRIGMTGGVLQLAHASNGHAARIGCHR